MPVTNFSHPDPYTYQTGFDSYHECVPPGTLVMGRSNILTLT